MTLIGRSSIRAGTCGRNDSTPSTSYATVVAVRTVSKPVYYCDYCRKHGLSRAAMEKHEAICTMNPERVCRWQIDGHSDGTKVLAIAPVASELAARATTGTDSRPHLLTQGDIDWLRDEVDGCPACMLAALRQSGISDIHWDANMNQIFDYDREIERLRKEERYRDHEWY